MELWVGTSGYSYGDWVGSFYPPGTLPRRMLAHYARHFPLVELNYTFYRPPGPRDLGRLAARAAPGFQFVVKLHRSLSHEDDFKGAPAFREAVEPLRLEGRLLGLLCQYPQGRHYSVRNLGRLEELAKHFTGCPLAVEFRHRSWDRPEMAGWLEQRGLHLVSVDVPDIPALYPSGLVQSSRLLYVRFHSRRSESWYAGEKDRYDYLYSDEELGGWLRALALRAGSADRALLLFNNCQRGQAAANAQRVQELLERLRLPLNVVPAAPPENQQRLLF